ncbi:MAG: hypothetical protein ACI841_003668 [Planctomycetota bacterium]|jgi:hypothetical protein
MLLRRSTSLLTTLFAFSLPASGGISYVDSSALPGGGGTTWRDAFDSFDTALVAVSSPLDEIWVKQGIYMPSVSPSSGPGRTKTFLIPNGLSLYGGFAGGEAFVSERPGNLFNLTVLSGDIMSTPSDSTDDAYTVVTTVGAMPGANRLTVIDGFRVERGNSTEIAVPLNSPENQHGGGVYAKNTHLRLKNLFVERNLALRGGGLYFQNGSLSSSDQGLQVSSCSFRTNAAFEAGGAIATFQAGGEPGTDTANNSYVFNTLFESNSAGSNTWFNAHERGWPGHPVPGPPCTPTTSDIDRRLEWLISSDRGLPVALGPGRADPLLPDLVPRPESTDDIQSVVCGWGDVPLT